MRQSKAYARQVFLNCPFDSGYVEFVKVVMEWLTDRQKDG